MKKILIQLDTDRLASTFDCIVAHDSGADAVQSYAGVTPAEVRNLVMGAFFTRGIPDLKNLAFWIGGSDVSAGEQLLAEARNTFFGPFKVSLMLDSNGCNTTASTAVARLARRTDLPGKNVLVIGPGPVGLRSALLLAGEGCHVMVVSIPPQLLGSRYQPELARHTLEMARDMAGAFVKQSSSAAAGILQVNEAADIADLEEALSRAEILVAAGPAGVQLLPLASWISKPSLKWLLDFNFAEPVGIEGIHPGDDFAERGDKRTLGALAIGNPKMRVHKACIARLFEENDQVLDTEGVYRIAKRLITD
jgi:methylenetetrahydrofolate/methylenetetrahydromethanopterin dehydrogenase (NADP+)